MNLQTIKLLVIAAALAAAFAAGWSWRGSRADAEMADFQRGLAKQAEDQRALAVKVEASQANITEQSSERLDQQAEQQQKDVVYVDRKVIEYRDRWRDSACRLPAEWLQLYNRAIGTDPVPAPAAAGSATD